MVSVAGGESAYELATEEIPGATDAGGATARLSQSLQDIIGTPVSSAFEAPLTTELTSPTGTTEAALLESISQQLGLSAPTTAITQAVAPSIQEAQTGQISGLTSALSSDLAAQLGLKETGITGTQELLDLAFPQIITGTETYSETGLPDIEALNDYLFGEESSVEDILTSEFITPGSGFFGESGIFPDLESFF
jgi:hypothetical protein